MSKNMRDCNKDTHILMSEADDMMSREEDLNPSESQRDSDDEENPIQKDFLSFSSALSPTFTAGKEIKFEEDKEKKKMNGCLKSIKFGEDQEKKKINGCLKSIKSFFATYCEVTPVACRLRERFALVLTVFICSKMALEATKLERLVPQLFLACYFCLGYQMIENILLYRFSKIQTVESLFDLVNKALLTFTVLLYNLQYNKLIDERFMALLPFLFLVEIVIYRKHCLNSQSEKNDSKMIWRVFCLFQTFMIAAKVNNLVEIAAIAAKDNNLADFEYLVDFEWKETLVFLWFYLGVASLYAPFAVLLLTFLSLVSILTLDIRTLRLLGSKILGYIWNICWNLLNVVGLIILFGFFKKIESEDSKEDDIFIFGLTLAKNLSSLLAAFSALLFPILRKSEFNIFQDLGMTFQSHVAHVTIPQKKYTLVNNEDQNKTAFFLMIPSTCLNLLGNNSQRQSQKIDDNHSHQNKEERRLCYICENHASNAILAGCGHGGVCCKCAVKLIEVKNECMVCRKPTTAIYKIENKSEGIVQAHEFVEIK